MYRRNGISKKTLIVNKYSDRIIFIVYRFGGRIGLLDGNYLWQQQQQQQNLTAGTSMLMEREKKDHRHFTLLIISQKCTLYRFSRFFLNFGSPWLWGTVRCSPYYPTNQDLVTAPYRSNGISKKTLIVSKYSDRIIFIVYRLESTPTLNSKTTVDPILG